MNFLKRNYQIIFLAILGIVMFFVYAYLSISQIKWQKENVFCRDTLQCVSNLRFNTPDEVLNYYFSNLFANKNQLYYIENLNLEMNRVVFPRWALVVGEKVTPGSFLGLDLIYGNIGKIIHQISGLKTGVIIPFLTPFFAILAVIFFYLLGKMFFDKNIAFISSLLMLFFPGFWYYASRTMFNNVLFLSMFIMGLYFFVKLFHFNHNQSAVPSIIEKKTFKGFAHNSLFMILNSFFAGLFLGMALISRYSEVAWVSIMLLIILIFYRKNIKHLWPCLLISLVVAICCLIPVLQQNKILYGNYFSTGYPLSTASANLETGEIKSISPVQAIFLPFGFNLKRIIYVVYNYIFKLFWPWAILVMAGLFVFIKNLKTKEHKLFFYLLLITYYLLLYYGSWIFSDSPISNLISIGSSYIRYFLPLYIFSLPFIALLFVRIWHWEKLTKTLKIFLFIPITYYLLLITYYSIFSGPESLVAIKNNLITYNIQAENILAIVPVDAILLLDSSADKIVFPELKHIIVPQNNLEYVSLKKAISQKIAPSFFYFHNNKKDSLEFLNSNKFNPQGLEIYDGQEIEGGGVIYKLKLKK